MPQTMQYLCHNHIVTNAKQLVASEDIREREKGEREREKKKYPDEYYSLMSYRIKHEILALLDCIALPLSEP